MTSHIPETCSAWSGGWRAVAIMVDTMPPRDPDDDDDEDEHEHDEDHDEPAVVREPDE
jgi:hypothetical protein